MSEAVHQQAGEDVSCHILDCAEQRFRDFGYGKTTMAEIAGDAGMSAANVYRYFVNKQDLGAACVERCFDGLFETLRSVLRQPGLTAAQCLENTVIEVLRWTYHHASEQPRIHELVQMIMDERREMVIRRDARMESALAEILARGNAEGLFDADDVIYEARTVHAAIRFFDVPIFMGFYSLPEFEQRAQDVIGLILRGLRRR
ncbi:MAG: TetR/AcrR family transcriptional regulator [Chromatiales bacterium]|jgi:AcrR family transcriptional regulator|nr:TetR/AcrR family transcriptional regulator [Chromatiales bacterium]